MRVLVVDQDSASNLAIARSLRERYTVDAVTNKGDCLDLLRSNAFEVIVAGERLEDGSGLELLGQIAKKYASVLRIFAADPDRLKLLRGRLGPFELFRAIDYPIDPERLIAVLALAEADPDGNRSTAPDPSAAAQPAGSAESGAPGSVPAAAPQPRVAPAEAPSAPTAPQKSLPRGRAGHDQRPKRKGGSAVPAIRAAAGRAAGSSSPLASASAHVARQGRPPRGSRKPAPVRFPTIELRSNAAPSSETRRPRSDSQHDAGKRGDTATIGKHARATLPLPPRELDYRKVAVLVGSVAVIMAGLIGLGFKLFGTSGKPAPQALAATVHLPQSPPVLSAAVAPPGYVLHVTSAAPNPVVHGVAKRSGPAKRKNIDARGGAAVPTVVPVVNTTDSSATSALGPKTSAGSTEVSDAPSDTAPDAQAESQRKPSQPGSQQTPSQPASQETASEAAAATRNANTPQSTASDDPPPVVREAKLIRRVSPDYPSAAKRDGLEGFVDVEVTVSPQGIVTGASVVDSNRAHLFDKSALAAIRKWKYDPRFVDGLPAEARLHVHLDFKPGM